MFIFSHKFLWVRDSGTAYLGGSGPRPLIRLQSRCHPGCSHLIWCFNNIFQKKQWFSYTCCYTGSSVLFTTSVHLAVLRTVDVLCQFSQFWLQVKENPNQTGLNYKRVQFAQCASKLYVNWIGPLGAQIFGQTFWVFLWG